jgi:hypothetical protein
LTIKNDHASYKIFRAKPLTPAEKAEAKKLAPPPRTEAEPKEAPQPPPGETKK